MKCRVILLMSFIFKTLYTYDFPPRERKVNRCCMWNKCLVRVYSILWALQQFYLCLNYNYSGPWTWIIQFNNASMLNLTRLCVSSSGFYFPYNITLSYFSTDTIFCTLIPSICILTRVFTDSGGMGGFVGREATEKGRLAQALIISR